MVQNLRVEDLVLAALGVLCLLHLRRSGRPSAVTVAVGAVVVTGLVSAAIAGARGMIDPVSGTLFAVRPAEYWVAFPATTLLLHGAAEVWSRRVDRILVVVTVLQTAFAVLQYYFGLPIGFSHAAYTRAAGLTVGPYELGAISAALVVYWISRGRWTMASLAAIALAASISRVSILGAGIAVIVLTAAWLLSTLRLGRSEGWGPTLRRHSRPPLVVAGQLLSVVAAGLVLAFTVGLIHLPALAPATQAAPAAPEQPIGPAPSDASTPPSAPVETLPPVTAPSGPQAPSDSIAARLASTSVIGSWIAAQGLAAQVPHAANSTQYQYVAYPGLNIYVNANTTSSFASLDPSNLIRFFRWHLILDTFDDPVDVVFGLGPSFVGPSVDGSYLRMFADGGLLGVLAWLALIVCWLRRSPIWMVCVTISLLVGATFIDILYSERPMVLFWALLALAMTRRDAARTGRNSELATSGSAPSSGAANGA